MGLHEWGTRYLQFGSSWIHPTLRDDAAKDGAPGTLYLRFGSSWIHPTLRDEAAKDGAPGPSIRLGLI
jgi:hypothetical protein